MRILFVTGGAGGPTVFALAPLATAARNAGHDILVAAPAEAAASATEIGLPAVAVTPVSLGQCMFTDRSGNRVKPPTNLAEEQRFVGSAFARLALASREGLSALGRDWRPQLVVGGSLCYAAGLLARELGVPYVRHAWDAIDNTGFDAAAVAELEPELSELGLTGLPEPDLFIEITPPSLLPADARDNQPLRFVAANRQLPLEPWMYTRGERRRVCVTGGSRVGKDELLGAEFLRELAGNPAFSDLEIVVAAPDDIASELRTQFPEGRVGWVPLDVLVPTCDLLVHHGGGATEMTALSAGVPQLLIPARGVSVPAAQRIADYGAAITLPLGENTTAAITAACEKLLADSSYRDRAREIAREIAALPPADEVVSVLERLVEQGARVPAADIVDIYARADVYEAFYRGRGKDYAAESEIVIGHVRDRAPAAASLLDVACGTGSHLKFFADAFDRVAGLDISAEMLEIARSYVPDVPVTQGDMRDFTLGETFDAITCMFSSFGYLPTEEDLDATLRTFARHLNPGGVVVVEPWWFPDTFTPGHVAGDVVTVDGRTISRISHTVREPHGRASRMEVNYVVAERESGLRHFTDTHVMSLFDRERYQAAFERAGLTVEYVPYEHVGPGLFVGVRGQ